MWVKKIRISYSGNGKDWNDIINPEPLEGDATKKIFLANKDKDNIVTIELPSVSEYPFVV
jgi:hypothetical protein